MKLTSQQLDTLATRFRLSPRETEIVATILTGITDNRALAEALGLTVGTTKVMLHGVYAKTRCSDKTQLVLLCLELLHPEFGA